MNFHIITLEIPKEELKEYKHYIGYLFRNENGVYNICDNEEDIIKSNQWFKNLPIRAAIVNQCEKFFPGDEFITFCTNESFNNKLLKFNKHLEDSDVIKIQDETGRVYVTVDTIFNKAVKFFSWVSDSDKQKIVNKQSLNI